MTELNDQQLLAKQKIRDFLKEPNQKEFILEGYAGTGKTFTLSTVLYHNDLKEKNICFTATTNKAVSVLRETGKVQNELFFKQVPRYYSHTLGKRDYKTIHKLLAMKRDISHDGSIKFIPTIVPIKTPNEFQQRKVRRGNSKYFEFHDYDIIVIDEASMVSNEMYDCIQSVLSGISPKIIWIGDRYQLPPVNEGISKVFRPESEIPQILLTKIERIHDSGSSGNVMRNFQLSIRESIKTNKGIPIGKYKKSCNDFFKIIQKDNDGFIKKFMEDYFSENTSKPILLGYTNALCNSLNRKIRTLIMKKSDINNYDIDYIPNESIVFNNYYQVTIDDDMPSNPHSISNSNSKTYTFYTSQQETVHRIEKEEVNIDPFFVEDRYANILKSKTIKKHEKDITIDDMAPFLNDETQNETQTENTEEVYVEKCPICLEEKLKNTRKTVCGHKFCDDCIREWLDKNKVCPLCRMDLKDGKLYLKENKKNKKINDLLDEFYEATLQASVFCWKLFIFNTDELIPVYVPENKKDFRAFDKKLTSIISSIDNEIREQKTLDEKTTKLILKEFWSYYYQNFKDKFADISYGYAITTHKSQGSTYPNCYVHMGNILGGNKKRDEALRCLYTSATRPSNSLTLFY